MNQSRRNMDNCLLFDDILFIFLAETDGSFSTKIIRVIRVPSPEPQKLVKVVLMSHVYHGEWSFDKPNPTRKIDASEVLLTLYICQQCRVPL